MSIYFFYGDEEYFINKELEKYRSKLDSNFSEMNYVVYDKLTYPDFISVIRALPMMFGKKMIVINTHKLFSDGNKRKSLLSASLDDNQIKEIEAALEDNNEMLDIFFVERFSSEDEVKKPDSRRKIFKILSKYTTKEFPSVPSYKRAEIAAQINIMAREKKIKVLSDAMEILIDCKGNNFQEIDVELDKLQLLAYPEKNITKDMVKEVCTSNEDLFNLTDYLMAEKTGEALLEVKRLLVTRHPLEIISPLQTMLKRWIYLKLNSKTQSNKELAAHAGISEGAVYVNLQKMKGVKPKFFVDLRNKLTEAEYRIKSGQAISPEEELENAIIR